MKQKTITAKKTEAQIADELGDKYDEASNQVKTATTAKNAAAEEIKALAKQSKATVVDGQQTFVVGTRWKVGFLQKAASVTLNTDKALEILPPHILKKCTRTVIDEQLFSRLVELGEIDAKTAKQLLVTGALPSPAVAVKKV